MLRAERRRPDRRDGPRLRLRQRRHRHLQPPEPDTVCLLPEDPDASARGDPRRNRRGRRAARSASSSPTASAAPGGSARPRSRSAAPGWRRSTTGAGAATPAAASCEATLIAIADEAAAAADLVRDKASGVPAAVVRGLGRSRRPPRTDPGPPRCAAPAKRTSSAERPPSAAGLVPSVEQVLDLVGQLLDPVLGLAAGLVDLALALQVLVAGEVAGGLLDPALGVIGVAEPRRSSSHPLRCSEVTTRVRGPQPTPGSAPLRADGVSASAELDAIEPQLGGAGDSSPLR